VADTQAILKRIGLTPGKAILIGVLAFVLVAVVYKQFATPGAEDEIMPQPASSPPIDQRAAVKSATAAAVASPAPPANARVELRRLDQSRWKSPELSAVIAYDPFALPPSFPQPAKIGIAAALADGEAGASSTADSEQLAEALERLQQQLEELKQRGVHVIVNKNDHYVAMIGDRLVHVGDEINGFIVTEIDPRGVRVERKEAQ
jgi:hypothetical protein